LENINIQQYKMLDKQIEDKIKKFLVEKPTVSGDPISCQKLVRIYAVNLS
jgi:hypothetical protein